MSEKETDPEAPKSVEKDASFTEAWKDYPVGYPRIAERIAVKPETGIYRRFDALNARHILYLQAELCRLEEDLQEQESNDCKDTVGHRSLYAIDYECMLDEEQADPKKQLKLIHKIHQKLNQYSTWHVVGEKTACTYDKKLDRQGTHTAFGTASDQKARQIRS